MADLPEPSRISYDVTWAKRTGMSVHGFQRLRRVAGIGDEHPLAEIETVDIRTLAQKRILFVSASGSQHCLHVGVYEHSGKDFRELWSVRETPDGAGLCRDSACENPRAWVTGKHEVTVTVPFRDSTADVVECDHVRQYTYRWAATTYQLASQKSVQASCDVNTYRRALDLVFGPAANAERTATIQILPSFHPEWAIALDRTPNGLIVSRIALQMSLWPQLFLSIQLRKSPSQCIEEAKTAPVQRAIVPLSSESAQRFCR